MAAPPGAPAIRRWAPTGDGVVCANVVALTLRSSSSLYNTDLTSVVPSTHLKIASRLIWDQIKI
jgi:hypothetical protein